VLFRNAIVQIQRTAGSFTLHPGGFVVTSVSVLGLVLTPAAFLAAVLGVWSFAADPGWTGPFFVTRGLLSRYQLWFAIAVASQTAALAFKRWVSTQTADIPIPAI